MSALLSETYKTQSKAPLFWQPCLTRHSYLANSTIAMAFILTNNHQLCKLEPRFVL